MLVQLDPSAAPCPDEPGRWSDELRPGLCVEPWHDPVIDEVGHDPRSTYVETFWLPVLGPTTIIHVQYAPNEPSCPWQARAAVHPTTRPTPGA
jgi:hypothetical protein